MAAPKIVTPRGRSLFCKDKTGSTVIGFKTQLIIDPPIIAPDVRMMAGVVRALSSLLIE
jgi:hypothetical protein